MRISSDVQSSSPEDLTFTEHLLSIGEGKISVDLSLGQHKIQIDDRFLLNSTDLNELCDFVFPDLVDNFTNTSWMSSRAILCPTNDSVDRVNAQLLKKLPGQSTKYKSSDKLTNSEDALNYPEEFLNTLNPSGMPQHLIHLKPNCPIMLLRNLDPIQGHCNGTRYIINTLHDHVIEASIAYGVHAGKKLFIPRIPIAPSENVYPFQMQRRQFPIRLAFAMTANMAQGQILAKVGLYLEKDFFSHGLSFLCRHESYRQCERSQNSNQMWAINAPGTYTDNVVFHEVL